MASNQICFFYAPTWDYPPSGPIQLGNVIASVKTPHRPLHRVAPESAELFSMSQTSVQYTKEKMRRGKFSILTKFLSILGFGADVGVESGNRLEETFSFDTVKTTQFNTSRSYIQKCLEADRVRDFIKLSIYRKPVYVITGLKIVTGAKAESLKTHAVKGNLSVEVDATISGGVPISGGPGVEGEAGSKTVNRWNASGDFVFAFRVVKVVAGKAPGQVLKEEEYRKGAMLENQQEDNIEAPMVILSDFEDLDEKIAGFSTEELMEDENKVTVLF